MRVSLTCISSKKNQKKKLIRICLSCRHDGEGVSAASLIRSSLVRNTAAGYLRQGNYIL